MEGASFPFFEGNAPSFLPDGFLVDAILIVPSDAAVPVYLKTLTVGAFVVGGIIAGSDGLPVASFQVPVGQLASGTTILTDPISGASRGTLVFGSNASSIFGKVGLGTTTFLPSQTSFEGGCHVILPTKSVESIGIATQTLVGKIALAEGAGISLVKVGEDHLRVDATGATSALEGCCQPLGSPVKKINDAVADAYGNVQFAPEPFGEPTSTSDVRQILRIDPMANGVVFSLSK